MCAMRKVPSELETFYVVLATFATAFVIIALIFWLLDC